jgi:hypothetical protein
MIQYWLGVTFPRLRKDYLKRCYYANRFYAPTFVQIRTCQDAGAIPDYCQKKSATRPLANGPPWQDIEFDREYQWTLDWQPGKSGEISYTLEGGKAQQDVPDTPTIATREAEKIESMESEPGKGIECGCCFSEYVAVSSLINSKRLDAHHSTGNHGSMP